MTYSVYKEQGTWWAEIRTEGYNLAGAWCYQWYSLGNFPSRGAAIKAATGRK